MAASGAGFDELSGAGWSSWALAGCSCPSAHGGAGLGMLDAGAGRRGARLLRRAGAVRGRRACMAPLALSGSGTAAAAGGVAAAHRGRRRRRFGVGFERHAGGTRRQRGGRGATAACHGKRAVALDSGGATHVLVVAAATARWLVLPTRWTRRSRVTRDRAVDRTRRVAELEFDRCPGASSCRAATGAPSRVLDAGRIVLAADTLGAAQRMLDRAVAYAKQREQFGRAIGELPGGQAPVRGDGRRARACRAAGLVRGLRLRRAAATRRALAALPRQGAPRRGRAVSRRARRPRCTAASASPTSWACTTGSSASARTASCSAGRSAAGRRRRRCRDGARLDGPPEDRRRDDDARDQHLLAGADAARLVPAARRRRGHRGVPGHQYPARRLPPRGARDGRRGRRPHRRGRAPVGLCREGRVRGHVRRRSWAPSGTGATPRSSRCTARWWPSTWTTARASCCAASARWRRRCRSPSGSTSTRT